MPPTLRTLPPRGLLLSLLLWLSIGALAEERRERAALEDLAGREVHVRLHSSYYDSLVALNERFAREGRAPVQLRLVRDVYKYYAAYALQLETRAERLAAREKLKEQRTD